MAKVSELQFWTLFIFVMVRVGVLTYFAYLDSLDPTFFTYQNFILDLFLLLLLALSMWHSWSMELFTAVFFPIYWGTTTFVSLAIVVILALNGTLFTKQTPINNGTTDIGKIHAGDYIVHQWPVVEVMFVVLIFWSSFIVSFSRFFESLGLAHKIHYAIYFHFVPLIILLFYMVNFDFLGNYPTDLPDWAVVLMVAALALLVQAVLFLIMYKKRHRTPKSKQP